MIDPRLNWVVDARDVWYRPNDKGMNLFHSSQCGGAQYFKSLHLSTEGGRDRSARQTMRSPPDLFLIRSAIDAPFLGRVTWPLTFGRVAPRT
jgi:hypothetical protein